MTPLEWVDGGAIDGGPILPARLPGAIARRISRDRVDKVLTILAKHCDWGTAVTYVSRDTIAKAARFGRWDVDKALEILVEGGWIERIGGGRGPGNARRFRLMVPGLALQGELPGTPSPEMPGDASPQTPGDESSNAGGNAGGNAGDPRRDLELDQNNDDDDARDHLHTIARAAPSSSSSSADWSPSALAHRAAKRLAADHKAKPGYAFRVLSNWRTERDADGMTRMEKLEGWHTAGLTAADATVALLADAPFDAAVRSGAPPIDHGTEACKCSGDGWVPTVDDPTRLERCPGPVSVAS
jgi:hypothetical protein